MPAVFAVEVVRLGPHALIGTYRDLRVSTEALDLTGLPPGQQAYRFESSRRGSFAALVPPIGLIVHPRWALRPLRRCRGLDDPRAVCTQAGRCGSADPRGVVEINEIRPSAGRGAR